MISKVCQSCGLPVSEENAGTNHDASSNDEYCISCFKNGGFTDLSLTLHKLVIQLQEKVEQQNGISFEEMERLQKVLPKLKRWRMSSI